MLTTRYLKLTGANAPVEPVLMTALPYFNSAYLYWRRYTCVNKERLLFKSIFLVLTFSHKNA